MAESPLKTPACLWAHTTGLPSLGNHPLAHWVWRLPWSQMCCPGSWQCSESWLTPLPLAWSWFSASVSRPTGAPAFLLFALICQRRLLQEDLGSYLCHSAHPWLLLFFTYSFFLANTMCLQETWGAIPSVTVVLASYVLFYSGCLALRSRPRLLHWHFTMARIVYQGVCF